MKPSEVLTEYVKIVSDVNILMTLFVEYKLTVGHYAPNLFNKMIQKHGWFNKYIEGTFHVVGSYIGNHSDGIVVHYATESIQWSEPNNSSYCGGPDIPEAEEPTSEVYKDVVSFRIPNAWFNPDGIELIKPFFESEEARLLAEEPSRLKKIKIDKLESEALELEEKINKLKTNT